MKFLADYIQDYSSTTSPKRHRLATLLQEARKKYHFKENGDPRDGFQILVETYNRIGKEKESFGVSDNALRLLTGALLQDYLLSVLYRQLQRFQMLDVFAEARVALGFYPLWVEGEVYFVPMSEQSDLAVGLLFHQETKQRHPVEGDWPRDPVLVPKDHFIVPLIAVSSKIRVSKPEIFDYLGRAQWMAKGNPHCLYLQVGLRGEMKLSVPEVAQVRDHFFLLGSGGEKKVIGYLDELDRLLETIGKHLTERMEKGETSGERGAIERLKAELQAPRKLKKKRKSKKTDALQLHPDVSPEEEASEEGDKP